MLLNAVWKSEALEVFTNSDCKLNAETVANVWRWVNCNSAAWWLQHECNIISTPTKHKHILIDLCVVMYICLYIHLYNCIYIYIHSMPQSMYACLYLWLLAIFRHYSNGCLSVTIANRCCIAAIDLLWIFQQYYIVATNIATTVAVPPAALACRYYA